MSTTDTGGARPLKIVILGLSITSSWGNGHATTYRGLLRELHGLGHDLLFLERDVSWYADHRDMPQPGFCRVGLYSHLEELRRNHERAVAEADIVIVGSFVPEGVLVGDWVQSLAGRRAVFYDIDTPVTLAALARGGADYLQARQIAGYGMYLSFTGGPTLARLETEFGSPAARVLYCCVDPRLYHPQEIVPDCDLGYMGTYSVDRQPTLEAMLLSPAREWPQGRFDVAGAQYPADIAWPRNTRYTPHLPPAMHRAFYNRQRFALNITRADMIEAGWSPSVRIFEAAACGTPIISDRWEGLETLLKPDEEIFLADSGADVLRLIRDLSDSERRDVGERARQRILSEHTAAHRARELDAYAREMLHSQETAPLA